LFKSGEQKPIKNCAAVLSDFVFLFIAKEDDTDVQSNFEGGWEI